MVLREALGWRSHIPTWLPELLSKLFHMWEVHQPGKRQVLIIVFIVPTATYRSISAQTTRRKQRNSQDIEGFRAGCRPLQARHGSCAVLIIDNTNTIANWDLQLQNTLQEMAKLAADKRLYKVILSLQMAWRPRESGRAYYLAFLMYPYKKFSRVQSRKIPGGGLTENEARTTSRNAKCDTDKLIRECGTRILTLVQNSGFYCTISAMSRYAFRIPE